MNKFPKSQSRTKARPKSGFPYTDTEIHEALERSRKSSNVSASDFEIIIAAASEGAKQISSRRAGGARPRKTSPEVTKRLETLVDVYRGLSPKLQAIPTGAKTIERLRKGVLEKLGLRDDDDVISEETVRQDIRQVRPLLRLIQKGIIPPGPPAPKRGSQKTRQEMQRGRESLAAIKNSQAAAGVPSTSVKTGAKLESQPRRFVTWIE
jgi:hypothetical protein